ncbi:MAG TPA: triose-phosphate isomerase [Alphaproteobacteria bacterium]|nr:triose-phosphate isomerase [Alphaproteobacteria bacterium]
MKLIAGNWKMNGRKAAALSLLQALAQAGAGGKGVEVAIFPPFPLLAPVAAALGGTGLQLGAQDCSPRDDGAYTGDVSAAMLKDIGCAYVLVGHSERRAFHNESDGMVRAKMEAAHKAGLKTILCVGEKNVDMEESLRKQVVKIQLLNSLSNTATPANTAIAYEPVWAIGSGITPSVQQISTMHTAIRGFLPPRLHGARIIYGGSVKPENAKSILTLKGVDGVLPGGASLKAESFLKIIEAAQ